MSSIARKLHWYGIRRKLARFFLTDFIFLAALTAGFIFTGVLQIYGTTNRLSAVYYAAAAVFTEAVQTYLVPLYREAQERGLVDEAFYGTPELDADDSLMTVMDIASSMGGEIGETADFIMQYDLVNA